MTGHAVKPRLGADPCCPTVARAECVRCSRLQVLLPADAEARPRTVLLDGSFAVADGRCSLFIPHIPTDAWPFQTRPIQLQETRQ